MGLKHRRLFKLAGGKKFPMPTACWYVCFKYPDLFYRIPFGFELVTLTTFPLSYILSIIEIIFHIFHALLIPCYKELFKTLK